MTNDEGMTNDEIRMKKPHLTISAHSSFDIRHSFVIGHWSFVISSGDDR